MDYRVLINLCGHTDLPFVPHDPEDVSRWIAQLPKYTVILMNSLPKWTCLAKGLRNINFHRLWKSNDSLVTLTKGSWRKGEIRLSKSDGIAIWISEALYQDTRIEEGAFVSQYDNWPRLLSVRKHHELFSPDPPRLNLFYGFQQMNDTLFCRCAH